MFRLALWQPLESQLVLFPCLRILGLLILRHQPDSRLQVVESSQTGIGHLDHRTNLKLELHFLGGSDKHLDYYLQ